MSVVDREPVTRIALTDREQQILGMAAHGLSNAEIGERIHVSEDTIKTHIRRLFRKLGATNRAHAVHLAHAAGIPLLPPTAVIQAPAPRQPAEIPAGAVTHVLRIVDPADLTKVAQTPLAVSSDEEAQVRLRRLAGQVLPSCRVLLYRTADLSRPVARMQGFRV